MSLNHRAVDTRQHHQQLLQRIGDLWGDDPRASRRKLTDRRQSLQLELAGLEARQRALRDALDVQTTQARDRVEHDEIAEQLQIVARAREEELELLKQLADSGRATAARLKEAEIQLAETRARLAERQQATRAGAGGDQIAMWNRELLDLSIDWTDKMAQLQWVQVQLEQLPLGRVLELEESERFARQLQEQSQQAEDELRQAEWNWRTNQRPQAHVLLEWDLTQEEAAPMWEQMEMQFPAVPNPQDDEPDAPAATTPQSPSGSPTGG